MNSGNPAQFLATAVLVFFGIVAAQWLFLAREGIIWRVKLIFKAEATFLLVTYLLASIHYDGKAAVAWGFAAAVVVILFTKSRSRYIPAAVKRRVIARDLKGEAYDGRTRHLDHRVAFSRGGSHSDDKPPSPSQAAELEKR